MHHYAKGCFDWSISGQRSDNPLREASNFILSEKYKRSVTFVHPVGSNTYMQAFSRKDTERIVIS